MTTPTGPMGYAAALAAVPEERPGVRCATGVALSRLTIEERADFYQRSADHENYSRARLLRILSKATATSLSDKGLRRHLDGECRNCPCPRA